MTIDYLVLLLALTLFTVIVWSGVVAVVDGFAPQNRDRKREPILLALMVAPIVVGLIAVIFEYNSSSVTYTFTHLETVGADGFHQAMQEASAKKHMADGLKWAVLFGVGVYVAGAGVFIGRLLIHSMRLNQIAASAKLKDGYLGDDVAITSEVVPPFASLSGRIIIPKELTETLSADQLSMIVDHERAHIRRGDAILFLALSFVDAVFWISPFVRKQTNRCRLSAEIACDKAVTQSMPLARDAYATTLLAVLKHAAGRVYPSAPTLFSSRINSEHQIRIRRILESVSPVYARGASIVLMILAVLMIPMSMAQVAIARSASTHVPNFAIAPLDGRLVSGFGERQHPVNDTLDQGVIIDAPMGAPVVAPAAGRVVLIEPHPAGYGQFVLIDHGDGFLVSYGPQNELEVALGDDIAAGQTIARVPSNNMGLDPFFFIAVLKDGELIDPSGAMRIPKPRS